MHTVKCFENNFYCVKHNLNKDDLMLFILMLTVAASSSAPEEEPSDEALLAVVSHMDVSGGNYVGLNLPFNLRILCYCTFICPTGLLYVI